MKQYQIYKLYQDSLSDSSLLLQIVVESIMVFRTEKAKRSLHGSIKGKSYLFIDRLILERINNFWKEITITNHKLVLYLCFVLKVFLLCLSFSVLYFYYLMHLFPISCTYICQVEIYFRVVTNHLV